MEALFELKPDAFAVPTIVNYTWRHTGKKYELWCPLPEQPDATAEPWGDFKEEGTRTPFLTFTKRSEARSRARPG